VTSAVCSTSDYDADIDIASLDLDGCGATQVFAEEHEWGLLLRARTDDRVVGVEIWRASERLPGELLVALRRRRLRRSSSGVSAPEVSNFNAQPV